MPALFLLFFFFCVCFFLEAVRAHGVASIIDLMLNGRKFFATNRAGHHISHSNTSFLIDVNILYEQKNFVKGVEHEKLQ